MASNDAQRVKDALDIAEVVGEYVQLKRAGANFKGLCPFHSEKSASFNVHPERQIWHCFGCSEGGDVISFVQKIEGMEFVDALKLLATRAGIELKPPTPAQQRERTERARAAEVMSLAKAFYHQALLKSEAGVLARDYLKSRGFSKTTVEDWEIGFAPESWDALVGFLHKRGVKDNDIVLAGLANHGKKGGLYDRFRRRVMFPLRDVHGETVGFTARVLPGADDDSPKYVNTPQTVLYDKSRILFGLNKAKKSIREEGEAVLVEGQTDVISSHAAGVTNVVASSGTALTEHQVKLLKRFAPRIILAFDVDLAGSEATKRGILLAIQEGLDVRVARVPDGKDPDECIRQSVQTWRDVIADRQTVMDFVFELSKQGRDPHDVHDKKKIVEEVMEMLRAIPDVVEREHYLQKLAGLVRMDENILRDEFTKSSRSGQSVRAQGAGGQALQQRSQHRSDGLPSSSRGTSSEMVTEHVAKTLRHTLSENLLSLLLFEPSLLSRIIPSFREEALVEELRPLYSTLQNTYSAGNGSHEKEVIRRAIQEELPALASRIDALLLSAEESWGTTEYSAPAFHEAFDVAQRRLMEDYVRDALRMAQHALAEAEQNDLPERVTALSEKIQRMLDFLQNLSHASKEEDNEEDRLEEASGKEHIDHVA